MKAGDAMTTGMKTDRFIWLAIFTGVFLSLSCIVLGKALIAECSRQNGGSMQKVVVSVKNQIDRQGENSFSMNDMRKLGEELSGNKEHPLNDIGYIAQSGPAGGFVSNGAGELRVRLTGISQSHLQFDGLNLACGSFITEKQEDEGEAVAVIDEETAKELFKTTNAAGRTLEILGHVFRVVGVVEKEDTILERLTDDGLPDVFLPASILLELDQTAQISGFQVKTPDAGILNHNGSNVSTALQEAGKNPSNYTINDYNLKSASIAQIPSLFVFIIGSTAMFMLLKYVKNPVRKLVAILREGCRTDYISSVLEAERKRLFICLLQAISALAGMAAVWTGIRFKPYIPPEYIPGELIDFKYYSNLIKSLIQGGIQSTGYIAPHGEMVANTASFLLGLLFFVSAGIGLLLLYTGYRELKKSDMDAVGLILVFIVFFAGSFILLALIASWAGLPFMLDLKGILVLWTFIFLYILSIDTVRSR